MLNKIHDILNDKSRRENPDSGGYYRDVFFFDFKRRKYALKVDNQDNLLYNGFCHPEVACWEKYKDQGEGAILAPVIMHGLIADITLPSSRHKPSWLVMSKLQSVFRVRGNQDNETFMKEKIYPLFKDAVPGASWSYGSMLSPEFGDDLHSNNWGMNNRGKWLLLDYAEGGNGSYAYS